MNPATPVPLFDRRFLVVSGKGGVGRTTIAAALARAAVRSGRRVLLAQMDASERLARLLGAETPIGPDVTPVGDGLDAVNMTARTALHQYGLMVLRYETLYRALFENKAVQGFLAAIPGLDAYAMLGKAWWHTTETMLGRPKYDLVILDGPASGHAVTMLKIPLAIREAMPKGPLARDADIMRALLTDPRTGAFLIVTLPEELPARETSVLARAVRTDLGMPLGPLFVNGVPPAVAAAAPLTSLLERAGRVADPDLASTMSSAALLADRRRDAERMLQVLSGDPALPMIQLPRFPTSDLGPTEVDRLAETIYASVTRS